MELAPKTYESSATVTASGSHRDDAGLDLRSSKARRRRGVSTLSLGRIAGSSLLVSTDIWGKAGRGAGLSSSMRVADVGVYNLAKMREYL